MIYPLAGLVDVRNLDVRQRRTELRRVQLIVTTLGGQDFVLLLDLGRGERQGGREGNGVSGKEGGRSERKSVCAQRHRLSGSASTHFPK
jgi:hypothetical protein